MIIPVRPTATFKEKEKHRIVAKNRGGDLVTIHCDGAVPSGVEGDEIRRRVDGSWILVIVAFVPQLPVEVEAKAHHLRRGRHLLNRGSAQVKSRQGLGSSFVLRRNCRCPAQATLSNRSVDRPKVRPQQSVVFSGRGAGWSESPRARPPRT